MNRIVLSLLLFCSIALAASAADQRIIELVDGSVITGEVVSLVNGVYTIKSDSLGTLAIKESRVRSISQKGTEDRTRNSSVSGQQEQLQQRMTSDKDIMALIRSLQDDPEFRKALEDPEIQRAVKEMDIPALTANPKFMDLLNNPAVKEIKKKVGE